MQFRVMIVHYNKAHTTIDVLTVKHKPGYLTLEDGCHSQLANPEWSYVPLCCISFPLQVTQRVIAILS